MKRRSLLKMLCLAPIGLALKTDAKPIIEKPELQVKKRTA